MALPQWWQNWAALAANLVARSWGMLKLATQAVGRGGDLVDARQKKKRKLMHRLWTVTWQAAQQKAAPKRAMESTQTLHRVGSISRLRSRTWPRLARQRIRASLRQIPSCDRSPIRIAT
ncbi:hypothetical protein ECANGB1_2656 [Enterospora canceri]|uniref:Uncharacterized protein n=1 Tax=Enterospora canceri TaxID=1081671 RepID=A0A1Y1S6G7_9MICR|nr:hypothetical protein ECANGB1_2656 [Enterospora canceri]